MEIQIRIGVVFVVCLLTLALSGSAQQRARVEVPAYEGAPLILKCHTMDVGAISRCSWTVFIEDEPDSLGKELNKDKLKDNPKPRFQTSLDFQNGVCQLYISALEPSDIAVYSCGIKNLEGVNLAHETFKLVLTDIPKDFSIEYNGELYRNDQTLTEVPSGIRLLLNCSAGPSIQIATLDWSIEPSNGEESGNQIVGPEGLKTIISTIPVSLDAANKRRLRATCAATHPGYPDGRKTISLTLITSDVVPSTSRPSTTVESVVSTRGPTSGPTESPGFRRVKYGFFYIKEVIQRIKRSLKKEEAPTE